VADEVDDLQLAGADGDRVSILDGLVDDRERFRVGRVRDRPGPGGLDHVGQPNQWSWCWWVVTTVDSPASPMISSSRSGSLAASMRTCSPVDRQRSR
jgi:hypothetical protein